MSQTAWQGLEKILEDAGSVEGMARLFEYLATAQAHELSGIIQSFLTAEALSPHSNEKLAEFQRIFARVAEHLKQAERNK
jgi:hypothetical protein